jgi:hypothetical protein
MIVLVRFSALCTKSGMAIAVVALVVTLTRVSSRGGEKDLYTKKAKFEFACFVVFWRHRYVIETYHSHQSCLMNHLSCDCLTEKSEFESGSCDTLANNLTHVPLDTIHNTFFKLACFQHKKHTVSSPNPQ